MKRVRLGRTGLVVSRIGFGGIPIIRRKVGEAVAVVRRALDLEIDFIDTGRDYKTSEERIGKAIQGRREGLTLATKTSARDAKAALEDLEESRARLGVDVIDLWQLHNVSSFETYEQVMKTGGALESALTARDKGIVRHIGISSHKMEVAVEAVSSGHFETVQFPMNVIAADTADRLLPLAEERDIGFIAMKTQGQSFGFGSTSSDMPMGRGGFPTGEGGPPRGMRQGGPASGMPQATKEPEDLSAIQHFMDKGYTLEQAKLKAVWEDERVTAILSNITNLTILKENVTAATDGNALSALDKKVLERLAAGTCGNYCRACMQCETVMGADTRIPDVLRYMMYYNSYGNRDEARALFRQLPVNTRNKLATVDFSRAENACPNSIPIGNAMKEAVRLLG